MIVPTRRWYLVAAALAVLAPLAFVWPGAVAVYFGADVVWVMLLLVDAWRIGSIDHFRHFPLTREAPPAFSVGRPLPVTYRWRNPASRPLCVAVRETPPRSLASDGFRRMLLLGRLR